MSSVCWDAGNGVEHVWIRAGGGLSGLASTPSSTSFVVAALGVERLREPSCGVCLGRATDAQGGVVQPCRGHDRVLERAQVVLEVAETLGDTTPARSVAR